MRNQSLGTHYTTMAFPIKTRLPAKWHRKEISEETSKKNGKTVTGSSVSQNLLSTHQQKRHTYEVMEQRNVLPRHQKQQQRIKRTNPLGLIANVYHQARPPCFRFQLKAN